MRGEKIEIEVEVKVKDEVEIEVKDEVEIEDEVQDEFFLIYKTFIEY